MSKRALWLAISACCVSFVVVSCSSDGDSSPSEPQGGSDSAAGSGAVDDGGSGGSSVAGTKSTGAEGGVPPSGTEGGASTSAGVGGTSEPGSGGEPTGGGGEPTGSGGEPTIGEGGAGGAPVVTDTPCANQGDCQADQYCLKSDCTAQTGVCATPTGTGPVCACGGVTYLNGKQAIDAKVDVAKAGICSGAGTKTCGLKVACAKGQTCGTVNAGRAASCAAATPSVCWQLPAKCPVEKASYSLCTSDKCVGLCSAVASGEEAVLSTLACSIKLP